MNTNAEHEKVFSLIGQRKFEDAARIATRLINSGQTEGFFVHNGTLAYRRAERWFDSIPLDGKFSSAVETITPEVAQLLLWLNADNRQLRQSELSAYMRDVVDGRWKLNGEPIIISSDGHLNDGQHRCFAVLLTGVSIESVVSCGVSRETRDTVDIGGKRTGADRLNMAGVKNYTLMSAISSFAFEIVNGRKPSSSETDKYFFDHRDTVELAQASTVTAKGLGPAVTGVAALHLINSGYDSQSIKEFLKYVVSGENMGRRDPRMVLCKALFRDRVRASRREWLVALVSHYHAHNSGRLLQSPVFNEQIEWKL